jgi:hypothetical protein
VWAGVGRAHAAHLPDEFGVQHVDMTLSLGVDIGSWGGDEVERTEQANRTSATSPLT